VCAESKLQYLGVVEDLPQGVRARNSQLDVEVDFEDQEDRAFEFVEGKV
jgi:hypothetical protein